MPLSLPIPFRCLVVALLFLPIHSAAGALNNWDGPAAELAKKIAGHLGNPSTVTMSERNVSSMGEDDVADAAREIRAALSRQGIQFAEKGQAGVEVRVTFSETPQRYLWVAEIEQDGSRNVVMVQAEKAQAAAEQPATVNLVLQKIPLLAREEPMLDAVLLEASAPEPERLLVLGPEEIAIYQKTGTGTVLQATARISHSNTWPRDLRGRIIRLSNGTFEAYLPGVECHAETTPGLSVDCHASDEPWPLLAGGLDEAGAFYVADRNYFDGRVKLQDGVEMTIPPFFAAAVLGGEPKTWATSSLDGGTQFYGQKVQNPSISETWGSELADVKTGCGSGRQLLANRPNFSSGTDSLQAYEFANHTVVAVSAQVEFTGQITALWPVSGEPAAMAISHNLKTDRYEAFRIVVACGH